MTENPEQPELKEEENQPVAADTDVVEETPATDTDKAADEVVAVADAENAEVDAEEAEVEIEFVDKDGAVVEVDANAEVAVDDAPVAVAANEPVAAEAETETEVTTEAESKDAGPFTVQQQDGAEQAINPLAETVTEDSNAPESAPDSPIAVIDESPKPVRERVLSELFFEALDDGKDAADAFAIVRTAQLERQGDIPAEDMQLGLDAAQTAYQDAMETGSSPEEAFVMAGDAAARVMASRGYGRAA